MDQAELNVLRKELSWIDPLTDYYAITLLGTADGKMEWSVVTHWVGFVDDKPGREIRQASIIKAIQMSKLWLELGESYIVINRPELMAVFFRHGGNALIARGVAEEFLADRVAAKETAFSGPMGFKCATNIPAQAFTRAPTPKHRMRILKRDGRRCRICGRTPDDYTDVQLHIHHIRPWQDGGLTEDDNLITLCHTCHLGLDPHEDQSLFTLIDLQRKWELGRAAEKYWTGVRRYREQARLHIGDMEAE